MPKFNAGISVGCSHGCKREEIYDTKDSYTDEEWNNLSDEEQEDWKDEMLDSMKSNFFDEWIELVED